MSLVILDGVEYRYKVSGFKYDDCDDNYYKSLGYFEYADVIGGGGGASSEGVYFKFKENVLPIEIYYNFLLIRELQIHMLNFILSSLEQHFLIPFSKYIEIVNLPNNEIFLTLVTSSTLSIDKNVIDSVKIMLNIIRWMKISVNFHSPSDQSRIEMESGGGDDGGYHQQSIDENVVVIEENEMGESGEMVAPTTTTTYEEDELGMLLETIQEKIKSPSKKTPMKRKQKDNNYEGIEKKCKQDTTTTTTTIDAEMMELEQLLAETVPEPSSSSSSQLVENFSGLMQYIEKYLNIDKIVFNKNIIHQMYELNLQMLLTTKHDNRIDIMKKFLTLLSQLYVNKMTFSQSQIYTTIGQIVYISLDELIQHTKNYVMSINDPYNNVVMNVNAAIVWLYIDVRLRES
nr:hypothetical protein [Microctonus hyperodae filamentous virus]